LAAPPPSLPQQFVANCSMTLTSMFGPQVLNGIFSYDYPDSCMRFDAEQYGMMMTDLQRFDLGYEFQASGGRCQSQPLSNPTMLPMAVPPFATNQGYEEANGIDCQKWYADWYGIKTTFWINNVTLDGNEVWEPVRVAFEIDMQGMSTSITYDFFTFTPGAFDPSLCDYVKLGCPPLPSPSTYSLSGFIRSAVTGVVISGATVQLSGQQTVTTGPDGSYKFTNLAPTDYILTVSATGYYKMSWPVPLEFNINPGTWGDLFLIPVINPGFYSIVLTWGSEPQDLDAYLSTPTGCTISSQNPVCPSGVMDHNTQAGFGPVSITASNLLAGTYTYKVHLNSAGSFAYSNATVVVYGFSGLMDTIHISTTAPSSATWWTVFALDNTGTVNVINTFA